VLGRPPGARSRRSLDLARYIEATFGGMTPGQQAAQLAMVTPQDLKNAKARALDLRMVETDLPPMMLAMAIKSRQLAKAIGCEPRDAWLLLQKERADLMPYVHQRQPAAADGKGKPPATVFLIPEGEAYQGQLPDFSDPDGDDIEFAGEFGDVAGQVGQAKSDDTP
jgi:hypothetical protein